MLAGLAGQVLVLRILGPGANVDAFFASMILPTIVGSVFGSALVNVLTPFLLDMKAGERAAVTRQACVQWGLLAIGICLLMLLSRGLWLQALLPGFDESDRILTGDLVVFAAPVLCAGIVSSILTAHLRASDRMLAPDVAAAVIGTLALPAVYAATVCFGVKGAAAVFLGKSVLIAAVLFRLSPEVGRRGAHGQSSGVLSSRLWPLVTGGSINKLSPLVDAVILSMAAPGAFALYGLIQRAIPFAATIHERSIVVPWLPSLSKLRREGEKLRLRTQYRYLVAITSAGAAACGLVLLTLGKPVIEMVLGMNASQADVLLAWHLSLGFGGVLLFACLGQCTAAIFYSSGETRLIGKATAVAFFVALAGKPLAFSLWGPTGVAVAASFQYLVMFAILHRASHIYLSTNR